MSYHYKCIELEMIRHYNKQKRRCEICQVQYKFDDELKMKSDQLFKDLGTDTTTAIRMFLTQAVANNGFPFEIKRIVRSPYSPMTEEEILEKLEKSRESAAKGNHKSAEVVVSELRGKYGL